MFIKYKFATNEETVVEVSEEIGTIIMDSRREESNGDRKEHKHCWSIDAINYEGTEYSTPDFVAAIFNGNEERNARIKEAFSHLTESQQCRMLMLAAGLSEREIARREGKDIKTIRESIEAGRKKFKSYFCEMN